MENNYKMKKYNFIIICFIILFSLMVCSDKRPESISDEFADCEKPKTESFVFSVKSIDEVRLNGKRECYIIGV